MVAELRQVKLSDVQFNPDIYPRKAHDPALVQKYAGCLEQIEERSHFMAVAEDLELLDGRHRHLAYLTVDPDQSRTVSVLVYPVTASADKFRLAVKLNSEHGHQLSTDDKKRCVLDGYTKFGMTVEEIAKEASVRKAVALEWTSAIRQAEQDRENEAIFDLWMACYTQEQIAGETGIPQRTVADRIAVLAEKFPGTKSLKLSEYGEDGWARPLFDIWNAGKNANEVKHSATRPSSSLTGCCTCWCRPWQGPPNENPLWHRPPNENPMGIPRPVVTHRSPRYKPLDAVIRMNYNTISRPHRALEPENDSARATPQRPRARTDPRRGPP